MSKMDNLRAMREARYERAAARGGQPAAVRKQAPLPVAPPRVTPDAMPPAEPGEALCGHRNMSGRTCTRERGHSAKSHRYS
jgi:hypothetical protein